MISLEQQAQLTEFLAQEGQQLLPMLKLIEQSSVVVDELLDVMSKAAVEAMLQVSAREVAGPKQQGKRGNRSGDVRHHGVQDGIIELDDRQAEGEAIRICICANESPVTKTLRFRIPAYEAMRRNSA